MPTSIPFRTSPQLGPQLDDVFVGLPYWDMAMPAVADVEPSYKLGNREPGDDGYDYIWVQNGTVALAASARVNMDANFVATANGSGVLQGPPVAIAASTTDVPVYFHARVFAL